jgi:hypothetical protein
MSVFRAVNQPIRTGVGGLIAADVTSVQGHLEQEAWTGTADREHRSIGIHGSQHRRAVSLPDRCEDRVRRGTVEKKPAVLPQEHVNLLEVD